MLEALSQGHSYISFDLFADAKGFSFTAAKTSQLSGDEIAFQNGMQLIVKTPLSSRIVLFKNGNPTEEKIGSQIEFQVPSGGAAYPVPQEQMIANVSALEAIFRSATSGRVEPVEN